ncbi:MAG: GNAT family N-acetyltransferase [Deltaproteobacteria bacterium]|nr:GNAT family N-acetyltransferase [Deltaproteobacteria bacterium]
MARRERAPLRAVSIRDGTSLDAYEILRLWQELMAVHADVDPRFALADDAEHAFMQYYEGAVSRDDYRVRVAEERDGTIVGFAIACILANTSVYRTRWIGYVNDLCVTESRRGQGIGRVLAFDAFRWLKENGAQSLEVYVARKNDAAQRFWRRIGARDYLDRLSIEVPNE